jgi:hypothetical protein
MRCLTEAGLMADGTRLARSWCPFGHRVGVRRTRTVIRRWDAVSQCPTRGVRILKAKFAANRTNVIELLKLAQSTHINFAKHAGTVFTETGSPAE